MTGYGEWLAAASISDEVRELCPGYRAVLLVAEGIDTSAGGDVAEQWLAAAEEQGRTQVAGLKAEEVPHVAAWREAYRAFGAKPQRTRNSVEALMRRLDDGLPRINALADAYNAVSVMTATPLGGEDLAAYQGPLRLVRASGDEPFGTLASGAEVVETPEPGEVVWRDDAGVTCRRWNWRQCFRTRLTDDTRDAVFIADVLDVEPGDGEARADEVLALLSRALQEVSPGVQLSHRILR